VQRLVKNIQKRRTDGVETKTRIQLLADKPKRPEGQKDNLSNLERAARDDDGNAAAGHIAAIYAARPLYMANLLLYKLEKHRNDAAKLAVYMHIPPALGALALRFAVQYEYAVPIRSLVNYLFNLTPEQRLGLATGRAAFFINHVLATAKEVNPVETVSVLEDTALTAYLKANAAAEYAAFATATPQLNVVEELQEPGALPVGATNTQIVDAIFNAIIHNTSIEVAYFATQVTPVEQILTGDTENARTLRERQVAALPDIPPIPATDCHHLLSMFQSIVAPIPALTCLLLGIQSRRPCSPYHWPVPLAA